MIKDYLNGKTITFAQIKDYMRNHDTLIIQTTKGSYLSEEENADKTGKMVIIENALDLDSLEIIDRVAINPEYIVTVKEISKTAP